VARICTRSQLCRGNFSTSYYAYISRCALLPSQALQQVGDGCVAGVKQPCPAGRELQFFLVFWNNRRGKLSLVGHTHNSRVNPTAGDPRQSPHQRHTTLFQEVPSTRTKKESASRTHSGSHFGYTRRREPPESLCLLLQGSGGEIFDITKQQTPNECR
jgi:hypothetical protein